MSAKEPKKAASTFTPSEDSVVAVLDRATGPRRDDAETLISLLKEITGCPPVVWGGRIIGFGEYSYKYESGREGRAAELAFSSGAANHTFYLVDDFAELWPDLMERLGKYRVSKACLYVTRLSNVDPTALRELLVRSLEHRRDATTASP